MCINMYVFISFRLSLIYFVLIHWFFYFVLKILFCIGIQLVNNVVIVSGGQQGNSAIHIQVYLSTYPLSPRLPSHPGCHITLSRVPCAIREVLVGYSFQLQQCVHVHPKLPCYPFPSTFLPATRSLFFKSLSLFCK